MDLSTAFLIVLLAMGTVLSIALYRRGRKGDDAGASHAGIDAVSTSYMSGGIPPAPRGEDVNPRKDAGDQPRRVA